MSNFELSDLLTNLQVERIDTFLFRGVTPDYRITRVFGGQVLAQALHAAISTVSADRHAHSLHAYFLRPGHPKKPINYEVEPIRDGGSFNTRRVVATQEDKAIFNTSISFQVHETGPEHQFEIPKVPGPEGLEDVQDYWKRIQKENPSLAPFRPDRFQAIDLRALSRPNITNPKAGEPMQGFWVRTRSQLPDSLAVHQILLSYISDMELMGTALRAHPINYWTPNYQGASLDHAMWFHSEFRADEWLYYHMDSPRSAGARGLNRGSFYTQDGRLVASTAQEGLMRLG